MKTDLPAFRLRRLGRRSNFAFTITEVMVSMAIMLLVMAGFTLFVVSGLLLPVFKLSSAI